MECHPGGENSCIVGKGFRIALYVILRDYDIYLELQSQPVLNGFLVKQPLYHSFPMVKIWFIVQSSNFHEDSFQMGWFNHQANRPLKATISQ